MVILEIYLALIEEMIEPEIRKIIENPKEAEKKAQEIDFNKILFEGNELLFYNAFDITTPNSKIQYEQMEI